MSESGDIIRRLVEGGQNYQTIGVALGRDRSLVRQVAIGTKPGRNLRDALAQLERKLSGQAVEVQEPTRRTTRRGSLAGVRKPTTRRSESGSWSSSTVKRTAIRGGAKGLGHPLADAAEAGHQVAVTVSVDGHLGIEAYGSSRRGRAGLHGSADFKLGDAEEVAATIHDEYAGDVAAYIADVMVDQGLVSSSDASYVREHIVEIDMRTW